MNMGCLSFALDDKGRMQAWIALFENPSRRPNSPLFAIDFRNLHKAPERWNSTMGICGRSADQLLASETTCWPLLWWKTRKSGRPATKSGRPTNFLSWFLVFCNKGKERGTAKYLQHMCAWPLSRHCISSRECSPRFSCHQSRIPMHDGRGVEFARLNGTWMHT